MNLSIFPELAPSLLCLNLESFSLDIIYIFCLILGVGYTFIQMLMGGGHEGGGILGDVDIDVGDVDVGMGNIEVADVHDVHIHTGGDVADDVGGDPSPVNVLTITNFVASFGGIGIVSRVFGASPLVSVLISVPISLLIAYVMFLFVYKFLFSQRGSSIASYNELKDITAEVITPISADRFGEVAYVLKNSRMTSPAKSITKEPIKKGELVKIISMAGSTAFVKRLEEITEKEPPKAIEQKIEE